MTTIRPAEFADLPDLAELWQERMTLLAHDHRFALADNGRERWLKAWENRLTKCDYTLLSAFEDDQLVGYGGGQIQPAPLGLRFESVGVVLEMAVDAHGYHGGVGRELATALRQWFQEHDVTEMVVALPRLAVVDQAFWRGLGAAEWIQCLWVK